ncbi:GAF domain-containing sensor histidine kinase [Planomonospora sp. ID67723]|uniref:GAF domain-containing sensor histidine kinase n=1 Tax=Planomonospora sp. ID67723 TaxID=2738134 RepID=UPI0018C40F36|nr:GAF domain-containing sensor histidine kinase [Planomonospora sp. ID67723]MBG0833210.1 GAF domain-containing sensor histidine kinase [Planomonospora sp. ID67723]
MSTADQPGGGEDGCAAGAGRGASTPPPTPADEIERLRELAELEAVEAPLESILTAVAELAARICHTPIALVNLISERLQHLRGRIGVGMEVMDRNIAFCPYTICDRRLMEIPDALADPRFCTDPLVAGDPDVRFYAGAPVVSSHGHALGTVCVMDRRSRRLNPEQRGALKALATCVAALVERHHHDHQSDRARRHREDVEDLKQLFLRSVNHELRTPLTSIRSYLHLIQDGGLDAATTEQFLTVIERNSDRLLEKLDELLLMASLSAQTVAFAPEVVDLVALVGTAVAEADAKARHKRHTLTLEAPEPVMAWADAGRLWHALVHLLDNAIKFTPDGGRIEVLVTDGPVPSVEIHDTGIGVSDGEVERVFDDFYRTSEAESQAISGIGVGLSIVKKIIALHGGQVHMTSTPHQGTCVHVTLLAPPAPKP